MAETVVQGAHPTPSRQSYWIELIRKEDWWAIWIGLGLVIMAAGLFAVGASVKWLAVAPQKWSHWADSAGQLRQHGLQYVALFLLWAVVFGTGAAAGCFGVGAADFQYRRGAALVGTRVARRVLRQNGDRSARRQSPAHPARVGGSRGHAAGGDRLCGDIRCDLPERRAARSG